ncbi:MAG: hypothetical protein JJU40_01390 [Rhodobacteraceae bacterium]|nr:hypothetical protein [Paracoccaceae bacterium]
MGNGATGGRTVIAGLVAALLAVAPALAGDAPVQAEVQGAEAANTGPSAATAAGSAASAGGVPAGDDATAPWPNAFGAALLADLAAGAEGDANIALSPRSLAMALTMTARGAGEGTAREYADVLGYDDAAGAAAWLGALAAELSREGEGEGAMIVALANGLWSAPDLPLHPAFADAARADFGAEVARVDFDAPETVAVLNGWFADQTRGMIPQLFDQLPADTRIVLGNALYLKGSWLLPFDPEATEPAPFHAASGDPREVAMMHQAGMSLMVRTREDHSAVLMPFADPDFEAMLILPAEGVVPEALLAQPGLLEAVGFRPGEGRLALPRLDIAAGGDMSDVLRAAGLFASQDYADLSPEPLVFDTVVHRTALVLDETGAEAAAATGVVGVRSSAPNGFDLVFDRPFLLALRHVPSETVLYLARVAAP